MNVSIGLILVLGAAIGVAMKTLKIPFIVGVLCAGVLFGSMISPGILRHSASIRELALIVILFRSGLSLSIDDFKENKLTTVLLSFVPATFEIFAYTVFARILFPFSWIDAFMLGTIIASVSPAVVVPAMLQCIDKGLGQERKVPQIIIAAASIDDVFNIVLFASALTLAQTQSINVMSFLDIPVSLMLGVLIGGVMAVLLLWIHKHLKMPLYLLFGIALLLNQIQLPFAYSGYIAIIVFGMTLRHRNGAYAAQLSTVGDTLWQGAQIFLFFLVGASIQLSSLSDIGLNALVLIFLGLFVRYFGVRTALLSTTFNRQEQQFCTIANIPKATVQAAIGGIPLALGLPHGQTMLSISVLAICITAPIGAWLLESFAPKLLSTLPLDLTEHHV